MLFFQFFNSPVALRNLNKFGPQEKVEMTPLSGGLFRPSRTCFWKKAILPRQKALLWNVSKSLVYSWGFIRDPSGGFTTLPCKDTWNLVLVHLRKIPRSAGGKYRFSLQLYTKMHGFKYEFSKFVGGGGSSSPLPRSPPPLNLRLHPRFSGALRPRFGLRPQFTPLPTEGY